MRSGQTKTAVAPPWAGNSSREASSAITGSAQAAATSPSHGRSGPRPGRSRATPSPYGAGADRDCLLRQGQEPAAHRGLGLDPDHVRASATATTPTCPAGRTLTAGGFSANGSQNAFFGDGSLDRNGTWSATGYGYFGPVPSFTAYGYCLKAKG